MAIQDTFPVTITLKNGFSCEHKHVKEPQSKVRDFINEVLNEFTKSHKGILTLPNPFGIYRFEDISGIIFHIEQKGEVQKLGYHAIKSD